MENPRQVQTEMSGPGVARETVISPYADMTVRRWQRRRLTLALSVALGGTACSLLLGRGLVGREQNYAKAQFAVAADKWIAALQRIALARLRTVNTTAAFFRGSDVNDRKDFHTFVVQAMKDQPSIEMLAWAPRIPAGRRKTHEEAARAEGFPKYEISQKDGRGQLVAAGKRDCYYPILLVEPLSRLRSWVGLDLGGGEAGRTAMRRAITTGAPVAFLLPSPDNNQRDQTLLCVLEAARYESTAVVMVKRPPEQPELDGFVLGVIRVDTLVESSLNHLPDGIDIYISAQSAGSRTVPVYTRRAPPPAPDSVWRSLKGLVKPSLGHAREAGSVQVADTQWTVECFPTAAYIGEYRTRKPLVAVLVGLLTTALSIGFFWQLTGRIASVQRVVAERWRDLRESDQYMRQLIDTMGDAFFLHDGQGKIVDVNKQACDSLGYTRKELLSMTIAEVAVECAAGDPGPYEKGSDEEYPLTLQQVHRRKDGTTFPVEARLTLIEVRGQRLILTLAHDITDHKRAERAPNGK
jgi:PAS domain S-box-containing protein